MIDRETAHYLVRDAVWHVEATIEAFEDPEEKARMRTWLLGYYAQKSPTKIKDIVEVPCGWLGFLEGWDERWPYLVNKWSGELIDLFYYQKDRIRDINAKIRHYISQLPEEQRRASEARRDLLPFAPIRFYPPVLELPNPSTSEPIRLRVEYDRQTLSRLGLKVPDLIPLQVAQPDLESLLKERRISISRVYGLKNKTAQEVSDTWVVEYELLIESDKEPMNRLHVDFREDKRDEVAALQEMYRLEITALRD